MPLTHGQRKLYSGDFNVMNQVTNPDGTVTVTMFTHSEPNATVMHIANLYGVNEQVLEEHQVSMQAPAHIQQRQHQAQQ